MKTQAFVRAILLISILAAVQVLAQGAETPAQPVRAQPPRGEGAGTQGGRGLFGDWDLKVLFDGREMNAILSFGRNEQGSLTAEWISFFGVSPLKDVKFEDGKLSFVQVVQFGDDEFRSTFAGTLDGDALKGKLSGDRGDSEVAGQRSRRESMAAGHWELNYTIGDMDITAGLTIKEDKDGTLTAAWKSDLVQSEVSDVKYERGTLSLKRKIKMQDREWDATFEGSIDRETGLLAGTLKSEMGDAAVEGKRLGEAMIGSWDLDITMDGRPFKQRMRVNADMSGLWGTLPIDKVELKEGKVTFKVKWEFGEQSSEMTFDGRLSDGKLAGRMNSDWGSQEVEGKKNVRTFRRG